MKKIIILFIAILISSCDNENTGDCFQALGDIIQVEVEVENFNKIVVHERVELIITQGDKQKVIIESGENLLPEVSAQVINNELVLRDNNSCNFFREYGTTKVYVTSPNITKIRNASERNVSSEGTLTYPNLYLMSVGDGTTFLGVGDFHLNIENEKTRIWGNGIGVYNITGFTNNLDISFSDGDSRFNGKDFKAKHIKIKHVSPNDILVYPTESLIGSIHSTGDIISYNKPPIVEVEALTSFGKLLFK